MSRFGIAVRSMDVSDRMCLMDVLRGGGVAGGSTAMSGGCAFGSFAEEVVVVVAWNKANYQEDDY
eukprot:COSAG06_NODE_6873_length_2734_cov_3.146110_2_plen_65_part_00